MSLKTYQPRNILVTGGAGFIGSHFIHSMLKADENCFILNLDLLTYAAQLSHLQPLSQHKRYAFQQGDITDSVLVKNLLERFSIDTIVHFAAESHVDRSIQGPAPFIQTNVVGTFVLLEAAREYWLTKKKWDKEQCRFHHVSTDEVYGSLALNDPAFSETTAYAPNSPYSASKAGSDHLVRAYFHTYQLPVTISNCSNNYGPYQHSEKFIPTVIRNCLNQTPIPVYGNGSNIRDWLYVVDHCEGIQTILAQGRVGEVYNIGGLNEVENITVAKTICSLFDKKFPQNSPYEKLITYVTDRAGHDWRYAIDITKISQELSWKPKETFITGLARTVDFYCSVMP